VKINEKWIKLQDFVRNDKKVEGEEEEEQKVKKKKKRGEEAIVTSTYPYNKTYGPEINYFKVQLEFCHRVASSNDRGIEFLAKKPFPGYDQPLISADEVFACLQNEILPGTIRASYCHISCIFG